MKKVVLVFMSILLAFAILYLLAPSFTIFLFDFATDREGFRSRGDGWPYAYRVSSPNASTDINTFTTHGGTLLHHLQTHPTTQEITTQTAETTYQAFKSVLDRNELASYTQTTNHIPTTTHTNPEESLALHTLRKEFSRGMYH